jgi:hypothetical protein
MMPRSVMIREITGMLVTAIARAKTSTKAVRLPAGPRKRSVSYSLRNPRPARNGTTLPSAAIPAVALPSRRERIERSSAPEQYISSSSPSW